MAIMWVSPFLVGHSESSVQTLKKWSSFWWVQNTHVHVITESSLSGQFDIFFRVWNLKRYKVASIQFFGGVGPYFFCLQSLFCIPFFAPYFGPYFFKDCKPTHFLKTSYILWFIYLKKNEKCRSVNSTYGWTLICWPFPK